jgi:hypothetical protein
VGSAKKNIISVDFAVELMLEISTTKDTQGKIFHITTPENYNNQVMLDGAQRILGIEGLYLERKEEINFKEQSSTVKKIHSYINVFNDYMTLSDPTFDMENTYAHDVNGVIERIPKSDLALYTFLFDAFFRKKYYDERWR